MEKQVSHNLRAKVDQEYKKIKMLTGTKKFEIMSMTDMTKYEKSRMGL